MLYMFKEINRFQTGECNASATVHLYDRHKLMGKKTKILLRLNNKNFNCLSAASKVLKAFSSS
jgi:hypothetical protein